MNFPNGSRVRHTSLQYFRVLKREYRESDGVYYLVRPERSKSKRWVKEENLKLASIIVLPGKKNDRQQSFADYLNNNAWGQQTPKEVVRSILKTHFYATEMELIQFLLIT